MRLPEVALVLCKRNDRVLERSKGAILLITRDLVLEKRNHLINRTSSYKQNEFVCTSSVLSNRGACGFAIGCTIPSNYLVIVLPHLRFRVRTAVVH